MPRPTYTRFLAFVLVVGWAAPLVAADQAPVIGDLRKTGTVKIATSCAPAAQESMAQATALLHSFFYDEARRVFEDAAKRDHKCAMAQWGISMTYWHPLWTPPSPEEMTAGRQAISKAQALGGKTDIERGYIAALAGFYGAKSAPGAASGEVGLSCHGATGGGDHPARAIAYEKALEQLHGQHPNDVDAATFHALSLLASASPTDKTLRNQLRATQILEPLWAKNPSHPGIVHYLIHGYDFPPVAEKGLAAAKAYADIAPWVPHALHMPAHIFTRLGMWNEVIASNLASADASRQYAARAHPDATSFEELHALDYMVYAYLQTGQDAKAKAVVDQIRAVRKTNPEVDFAASYAMGAVPARYALERRQWAEAAALVDPPLPTWMKLPLGAGHLAFARALGAARAGRVEDARRAITELEQVAAVLTEPRQQYFGKQAAMQVGVVKGFLAEALGRSAEAEKLLRDAADSDDLLGKHPVSPGTLLPSRELLADFLLAKGRAKEALAEYEACLKVNPRRFNTVAGAARAAESGGDGAAARRYYADLLAIVTPDATRPEVAHARADLAGERRAAR
jgi:tetratricopeptide (TPR) repeat protein